MDTLLYEPFRDPTLADGLPNPKAQRTLRGWTEFVGVVAREAEAVLGSEKFDVEIWNELSFGSDFLHINNYYLPPAEPSGSGKIAQAIMEQTVGYLRDPAHGVPQVGIGNGFSNQRPWDSGTTSVPGLTAIDKHPYAGWTIYPAEAQVNGNRPLDGLGTARAGGTPKADD